MRLRRVRLRAAADAGARGRKQRARRRLWLASGDMVSVAGRGESRRRTEVGKVDAAGAASGWSPEDAAAAAALHPVERARVRGRGRGRGRWAACLAGPAHQRQVFLFYLFFIFLI